MRRNHKAQIAVLCCRDMLEMEPLIDLWIMGLLYKLIVRGSRLHGAFEEKGLVRSEHPAGGMCGSSPVFSVAVERDIMSAFRGDRNQCECRDNWIKGTIQQTQRTENLSAVS